MLEHAERLRTLTQPELQAHIAALGDPGNQPVRQMQLALALTYTHQAPDTARALGLMQRVINHTAPESAVFKPLARVLAYAWPVHRLAPDFLPTEPPPAPTFLLVRRGPDLRVHFHSLSPLTFRLLQRLAEQPGLTGRAQLEALANEAGAPDPDAFYGQGRAMLAQLRRDGVLLGTEPTKES